jgi:hypothetical protein
MFGRSRREFESEPGSIPVGAIVETGRAWGVRAAVEPADLFFLPAIRRVSLLVFLLVSATIEDQNFYKFKWLWH